MMMGFVIDLIFGTWVALPVHLATSSIGVWIISKAIFSAAVPDHVAASSSLTHSIDICLCSVSTEPCKDSIFGDLRARLLHFSTGAKRTVTRFAQRASVLSNRFERLGSFVSHNAHCIDQVWWRAVFLPRIYSDQTLRVNFRIIINRLSNNHIWS